MPDIAQLDPYKVQNITVLKRPNANVARELLQQVAKQVQPILRRRCARSWTFVVQRATRAFNAQLQSAHQQGALRSSLGSVAGNGGCHSCQSSSRGVPTFWCGALPLPVLAPAGCPLT